ncbi:MAG: hypothetical protein QF685_02600 [Verrucomicrobiota bacterium]|nr:hypothetical protein [Verrucomicrobiota bacterium]
MDSEAPPVLPTPESLPPSGVSPPPKRKSPTALYVILGLLLSVVGVVVVFVGGGALFLLTAKDAPVTVADRDAVLRISDVALWIDGFSPDPSKEFLKKTRFLDKSYDIEYEYDDSLNNDAPYLLCSITVEPSLSDARISYAAMKTGFGLGFSAEPGVKRSLRNDLFRWGDKSEFSILEADGLSFGNLFVGRKGRRVFMITISGVYFDEPTEIHDLLDEKLRALEGLPAP